jgi:DNA-binding response OmpR family regulator
MEAGADEFVKKPFSIQQLHLRMLDLLGMRENDATVQP